MNFQTYNPPERVLMGPGPSNINPRVLNALSKPTIGHLDPRFIDLMDEIKQLLKYAFQTENDVTFPVSAPGSTGMETCLVNLIEPGEKVVVCVNGVFGGRMKEIIERCGGIPVVVNDDWGTSVGPSKLEEALTENPVAKIAAFVHAETSTGALSDVKTLAEISRKHDCLTIVDTVTSLGGSELKVDEWELDAVYSGTQKCLSCPPGLSPVTFSEKAINKIKNRKTKVQSWFMDLNLVLGYWGSGSKRSYHHTAPINSLYGLHEALLILHEEGIENAWQRHTANGKIFCNEIKKIGLSPFVKEEERLSQLISVTVPKHADEALVRTNLLEKYNIEIGAGLGALAGKVWRVGLMGHTSNINNINLCVDALSKELAV
ncbi:MAG: alanine--glyoxylate aminotransferase family protein [Ignavibacteriae bacterium]|nr:alanine--glyoxylate aminotransferase family protein [Ignavibacteriota bacterium]NOG99674.1 alanine--glyoxylate aminotransferase family protein [Ignavibacteriota bacterium]